MFDREKNPIFLTENLVFKNFVDTEYFDAIKKNPIETELILFAKKATENNYKLIFSTALEKIKSALSGF